MTKTHVPLLHPTLSHAQDVDSKFTKTRYVGGLDSLRIVCALWVVFAHLGFFPVVREFSRNDLIGGVIRGVVGNLFAGPPAVIVFFLISGFCIHYPFLDSSRTPGWRYLLRRYLRIGVPVLAAVAIIYFFTPGNAAFDLHASSNTVAWSLLAEVIYYSIYPAFLVFARKWGWNILVILAFSTALLFAFANPKMPYLPSFGPYFTWLLGLPYWILGCRLAERTRERRKREITAIEIWKWRIGVWLLASTCSVAFFHWGIGFPWSLPVFGLICFEWLSLEIRYYQTHAPSTLLEWAGRWSYSIYAMHLVLPDLLSKLSLNHKNGSVQWLLLVILNLCGCYAFYLVVEKPSRRLARLVPTA